MLRIYDEAWFEKRNRKGKMLDLRSKGLKSDAS